MRVGMGECQVFLRLMLAAGKGDVCKGNYFLKKLSSAHHHIHIPYESGVYTKISKRDLELSSKPEKAMNVRLFDLSDFYNLMI